MTYVVVIFKASGEVERREQTKAPTLKQLNEAVGGYIQSVPHMRKYDGLSRGYAYCDEDGKMKGKPHNPLASDVWMQNVCGKALWYIPNLVGDVVYYAKKPKENGNGNP